ncbi:MAG: M14 family metallopeptidase [Sphingomonadaceae bacterium]|nr:succinylglutamate desuccinylase/aspartoacylase family protein [Sphingomonadaceae bacterium]
MRPLVALLPVLLAACATTQSALSGDDVGTVAQAAQSCSDGTNTIDGEFPGSGFARCEVLGKGWFRLSIEPEDAKVTNCSAWYAFRALGKRADTITVDLDYASCGHRYQPKIGLPGKGWERLDPDAVELRTVGDLRNARLTVPVDTTARILAGQELLLPDAYDSWLDKLTANPLASRAELGKSAQGRSIDRLTIAAATPAPEQVVLVGRQHPPEVTGGLAMIAFVERLLEEDDLAKAYRARFTTQVVPLLNPDGVVNGHWRHATGGVDLNRDWGPFTQPETRLMRDMLEGIEADPNAKLRLFLDFHSTRYDTIYTLLPEMETDPPGFLPAWLADYAARLPDYDVRVEPGHNPDLPVSKAWVHDRFGVPTATYEIGDETDRALIRRLGRAAAEAMMAAMLAADHAPE